MHRTILALALIFATCGAGASAACDGPEYRQFDFWVGHWRVTNPDGETVGHNRIESILEGCAVRESWRGARGVTGTSLNGYHAGRDEWIQTWMDSQGLVLELAGGLEDGDMVLSGNRESTDGTIHERIRWTPREDGTVIQRWERSANGSDWDTIFKGTYHPVDKPASGETPWALAPQRQR